MKELTFIYQESGNGEGKSNIWKKQKPKETKWTKAVQNSPLINRTFLPNKTHTYARTHIHVHIETCAHTHWNIHTLSHPMLKNKCSIQRKYYLVEWELIAASNWTSSLSGNNRYYINVAFSRNYSSYYHSSSFNPNRGPNM